MFEEREFNPNHTPEDVTEGSETAVESEESDDRIRSIADAGNDREDPTSCMPRQNVE